MLFREVVAGLTTEHRERVLIRGLVGAGSVVDQLKQGLDVSVVRSRHIAHRVANASNGQEASFEATLDQAVRDGVEDVDLETEMVQLADEQLRFETMSRVLQGMYGQIRSSLRST